MIQAMAATPDQTWTVPQLARLGDGSAKHAESLVERLTANGWATAFWDPPADRFDPQDPRPATMRRRCYRLTSAGKENLHRLLEPVRPERGLIGTLVFEGWESARALRQAKRGHR
jgi:hypothetical protein